MTYHVDRFHAAVSVLAGHGNIKHRLTKAYEDHLDAIDDEDLPIAVKLAFVDLRSLMYRVTPLNGEGAICASVRKMSVAEASECAVSIVSLYRDMLRHSSEGQVALPLDHGERRAVPPFLVKSS